MTKDLIKDRAGEHIQNKAHENKRIENKEEDRALEDTVEKCNLCITGLPEGEKRKEQKYYLMAENFSKLMEDIKLHIQLPTNPKQEKNKK